MTDAERKDTESRFVALGAFVGEIGGTAVERALATGDGDPVVVSGVVPMNARIPLIEECEITFKLSRGRACVLEVRRAAPQQGGRVP